MKFENLKEKFSTLSPRTKIGLIMFAAAFALYFLLIAAPNAFDRFNDYFARKASDKAIENLQKTRAEFENKAEKAAEMRAMLESEWKQLQPMRVTAQEKSELVKKSLIVQEQKYENAKSGNTAVNFDSSWDERRAAVLAEDARLYPAAAGKLP